MQSPNQVTTRPAGERDESFLYELYCAVRRAEFALLPLPEAQREAMVRQQYEWQTAAYQSAFPNSAYAIVLSGATPVGRIWVDRSEAVMQLVDIAIAPGFQQQGLATQALRALQREATESDAVIRSSVLSFNTTSIRLHQRLGFRRESESALESKWIWKPNDAGLVNRDLNGKVPSWLE